MTSLSFRISAPAVAAGTDPLLDAIRVPAWLIDRQTGNVRDVNSAATELYGWTRDELLTMGAPWLLDQETRWPGEGGRVRHVTRSNRVVEVTLLERDVEGSDTRLVMAIPVTPERRELEVARAREEQFRLAEERFNAFMDNSPTVAFMKQKDGRYVYANELMTRLFAPAGGTLLGRSDQDLLPGELAAAIRRNDDEVIRQGKALREVESAPTNDGDVRQWLTYKFPVTAPDGAVYVGGVAVDLTEQLAMERQLAEARDAALVSARQQSQFLANMSHEIRTPMNGVIGLLGLLTDSRLDPDQRDLVETARSSAESLLTIINDILDFSKIEAGKLEFEVLDFDVRSVCESTADLLADAARRKSLEIGYVVDPGIPSVLRGDPGRVRQVLLNLMSNAVKFTESGGVLLQVERVPSADGVTLRFQVTDTGIGMTAGTRQSLFRPFAQCDASTTRRFGGTGLGLAISKQLVQMMNGDIGVESEEGCGSTFWFTARFDCTEAVVSPMPQAGRNRRVLIVEDSATTRQTIALQLAAWEIDCDIADDGVRALAMLRAAQMSGTPYDLVISDLNLPGIDGVALARLTARNAGEFGAPRFILVTGSTQSFDAAALAQIGVTVCLRKPVKPAHLFSAVFGRSAAERRASPQPPTASPVPLRAERRVLVADDNMVNQKVALRQLQKLGFAAEAVANGAEALDALGRIAYDLVLMDCQMPEMDGYEATREIRRRESSTGKHTPVVALTASATEADREECLAAGMDDFVSKPVRECDLAAMLHRWLPQPAHMEEKDRT